MKFKVIIPARYDSSRFPGKVLKLIDGKTMLEHVYDNAKNSQADDVFIATDSDIVYEAASKFTKNIYMTSNNNKNGTERVAELSEALNWLPEDLVINLQADMPELKFDNINLLAEKSFNNRGLSTLYYNLVDTKLLKDKNTVKILVKDKNINFYRHYDGDNIVRGDARKSSNKMSRYEMVRILGERVKHLTLGAKCFIKNKEDFDYETLAMEELKAKLIPFKIIRRLPNNIKEEWSVDELYIEHLFI